MTIREDGGSVNFSDQKRVEVMLQELLSFEVNLFRAGFRELQHAKPGINIHKENIITIENYIKNQDFSDICYIKIFNEFSDINRRKILLRFRNSIVTLA